MDRQVLFIVDDIHTGIYMLIKCYFPVVTIVTKVHLELLQGSVCLSFVRIYIQELL